MVTKSKKIFNYVAVIFFMVLFLVLTSETAHAGNVDRHEITKGLKSVGTELVDTLESSNVGSLGDYVKVSCNGSNVRIEGNTLLPPIGYDEYRIKIVEQTGWGTHKIVSSMKSTYNDGRYYFSGNVSVTGLPDGEYNIFLYRGSDTRRFYRNCVLVIKDGAAGIQRYENVLQLNEEANHIMSQYDHCNSFLDTRLTDIYLMMRRRTGASGSKLTFAEVDYVKAVADRVTRFANNDYEKAFQILKYIDDNYYYDRANASNGRAITNPAVLIERFESGQEATTNCLGYAALFAALARAEGIPTRVLYGVHRMDSCWTLKSNLKTSNHHWTEFYYNGRWIMADADVGAGKYKEVDGELSLTDRVLSYTFFDATPEQIAQNYIILGIYKKPTLETPEVKIKHTQAGDNRLYWNEIEDATKYTIYRSDTKYGEYTELKTVKTKYAIDFTAELGNKYYYRVVAASRNVNREASPMSNIVWGTDKLATPIIDANATKNNINIFWESIEGATGYKIYRSTMKKSGYRVIGSFDVEIETPDVPDVPKTPDLPGRPEGTDTLVTPGEDGGEGSDSVTTPDTPDDEPGFVSETLKYVDKTAKKDTVYYYKVVAVHSNKLANSAMSDYVSAKRFTFK